MGMLYGAYRVTMDGNNRVKLPAAFHNDFKEQIMLVHTYHGLSIFRVDVFNEMVEKMYANAEADDDDSEFEKIRFLTRHSTTLPVDSQHRFTIPASLVEQIGLTNDLLIAGEGKSLGINNYAELEVEYSQKSYSKSKYPKKMY